MPTTLRLDASRSQDVARAAELLRAGGTVAFPTETVYGLGANALSTQAVERIFVAKQRPAWDPLIVHLAGQEQLPQVANVPAALEAIVGKLIQGFWPGALTLLLPRTLDIPDAVTAGRPLAGVRVPAHAVARELLSQAGVPIAAPSANIFGHTSPTTAQHVLDDLDGRIDAVLDGGPCDVGVESTVFDPATMSIYRPGGVTAEQMAAVIGVTPQVYVAPVRMGTEPLPSPGVGLRHYAPRARMVLVAGNSAALQGALAECVGECVGVMLPDGWTVAASKACIYPWGEWGNMPLLAARLFQGLRQLDDEGATTIVCPLPESNGLGRAICDRLEKAARIE